MRLYIYGILFLGAIVVFGYASDSLGTSYEPFGLSGSGGKNLAEKKLIYHINNQQDFNKYKNQHFPAGSKILFAQGTIFNGQFAPTGSGKKGKPIIISAYNPENDNILKKKNDNKPIINGQGKVNSTLLISNSEYFEVKNLEITNTNGSSEDQGELRGINVRAKDAGVLHHIVIKNCYIHDINGKVAGKHRGAIQLNIYGNDKPTRFNHIRILNNTISNIGGIGIGNDSSWGSVGEKYYTPWYDFVIRGNRIEKTGRNAIIVRDSKHPVVEYNVVAHSTLYETGNSIFNFNTVNCIMQYNEVYGNTGPADEHDHGAFDADFSSKDTFIQYNYSHDNNWFCSIMRKRSDGVTIRYNISQNGLMGVYFYGFPEETGVKNVSIYNNTHYFKKGINGVVFVQAGKTRIPTQTTLSNEIFYFTDQGSWGHAPDNSCRLQYNLFYNLEPKGTNYITAEPQFIDPGKGGTDINMKSAGRLSGYQLQASSPAIDAGIKIGNNGGKDFWGHPLYKNVPDIGAYEYQ